MYVDYLLPCAPQLNFHLTSPDLSRTHWNSSTLSAESSQIRVSSITFFYSFLAFHCLLIRTVLCRSIINRIEFDPSIHLRQLLRYMAPSRRKGLSKAAAAAAACRQWKVGDLVLAKVKGFPAWPATVGLTCHFLPRIFSFWLILRSRITSFCYCLGMHVAFFFLSCNFTL